MECLTRRELLVGGALGAISLLAASSETWARRRGLLDQAEVEALLRVAASRAVEHIEEEGWLAASPATAKITSLLRDYSTDPRFWEAADSRLGDSPGALLRSRLIRDSEEDQAVSYMNVPNVFHISQSFVSKLPTEYELDPILVHEMSHVSRRERKQSPEYLDLETQTKEGKAPFREDPSRRPEFAVAYKRFVALNVQDELEASLHEMAYRRGGARVRRIQDFRVHFRHMADQTTHKMLKQLYRDRHRAGYVLPDGTIDLERFRVHYTPTKSDERLLKLIAEAEGVEGAGHPDVERAWIRSWVNDPLYYRLETDAGEH